MKTLSIILSIVALSFTGASAQVKPEVKPSSIVGSWKVKGGKADVWTFAEPNAMTSSAGSTATWKALEAGQYSIVFSASSDAAVTISPDGKSLSAVGKSGKVIEASRVVEAADPIIGKWRREGLITWTFKADGTLSSTFRGGQGTWRLEKTSAFARKYELLWHGGTVGSVGEMESNQREMRFKDTNGDKFYLIRIDEPESR